MIDSIAFHIACYRTNSTTWDRTPFLSGVTEIRHFGGASIQVARRLRGMLEDLIQSVLEERAARLRRELSLLQRSANRFFAEPEDLALAAVGDSQGMGGMRVNGQATQFCGK